MNEPHSTPNPSAPAPFESALRVGLRLGAVLGLPALVLLESWLLSSACPTLRGLLPSGSLDCLHWNLVGMWSLPFALLYVIAAATLVIRGVNLSVRIGSTRLLLACALSIVFHLGVAAFAIYG